MSDVGGGNYGDSSESETDAASDSDEKSQLHSAEAANPETDAAEKPEAATEAAAQQSGEAQLKSAEAKNPETDAAEKPEGATESTAQESAVALMHQADAAVAWSNAGLGADVQAYPPPVPPAIQAGLQLNTDVAINVFFVVIIDTVDLGAWSKCTGLGMKIGTTDREESGMTLFQHHLPGHLSYEHITLERPLTSDCRAVMSWFMSYHMLPIPTSGVIICMNQLGVPVMSWEMTGITPVSWKGPSLDAMGADNVATEQLTFAHEGFL